MTTGYSTIIDKYYPAGTRLRDIYMAHCRSVADEAIAIARRKSLPLSVEDIEAAAMLHDIGIYATDAPSIECHGKEPYIRHGIIGGALLREEGVSEEWARVAERHTGAGLTAEDIRIQGLPLPVRDFLPESLLERLICYADKFFSKSGDMRRKPFDGVLRSMERFGPETADRFLSLHAQFA